MENIMAGDHAMTEGQSALPKERAPKEQATVRYHFPKEARLLESPDFRRVFQRSRKNITRHFVLHTRPNEKSRPRLGLTVSKKVGNAVVRNRIKRVTREFFRLHGEQFRQHVDCVVIARHRAGSAPNGALQQELKRLFKPHLNQSATDSS